MESLSSRILYSTLYTHTYARTHARTHTHTHTHTHTQQKPSKPDGEGGEGVTSKKTKKKKKRGGGGQGVEEQQQATPLTLELGSVLENLEVLPLPFHTSPCVSFHTSPGVSFHTSPGVPFHTSPHTLLQSTCLFCHLGSKVQQQVVIQYRLWVVCGCQEQIWPNQAAWQIG